MTDPQHATDKESVERLARRIGTRAPYKSAIQIACDEEINANDRTIGAKLLALGQGDYPTVREIADQMTSDANVAAATLRALSARIAELEAGRRTDALQALSDLGQLQDALDEKGALRAQLDKAKAERDEALARVKLFADEVVALNYDDHGAAGFALAVYDLVTTSETNALSARDARIRAETWEEAAKVADGMAEKALTARAREHAYCVAEAIRAKAEGE